MDNKGSRTEIQTLGEFGLIERIKNKVKTYNKSTIKGIGDDAAVISSREEQMVVSTDMLLEGIHFDLSYMPLKHLGYKSVVVNLSDIAAMNAIPKQITVNIGLSNRFSVEAVDELYAGIFAACENYKVDLVGGDTTASQAGLAISITAIGMAKKEAIVYRNNAKVNDIVCVTGDLGGAYIGLQLLEREKQVFLSDTNMQPQLQGNDYVIHRQLKPEARVDVIHEFKKLNFKPSAMIDISDGLASELFHICNASAVGVTIYEDKLPLENQTYTLSSQTFNITPITCALNGGEDYELLFTINQKDYNKVKNHLDITMIGYIHEKEKGLKVISKESQIMDLQAQGWTHFK